MKKTSQKEFIDRCDITHNYFYNYDKTIYKRGSEKIKIICLIHGEFEQRADAHKSGQGCPRCKIEKRKLKNVEEKFKNIHGDKYDYSLVNYVNNNTKVKIICKKHDIFQQTPHKHLMGQGCPDCKKSDISELVKKWNEIHDNKYDYSSVNYINNKTKIKIICPEHGIFEQIPNDHRKHGCLLCRNESYKSTEYLDNFNHIHNNKYDYSLVNYINNKTKIKIICNQHGEFEQKPDSHLNGQGCPKCNSSKGEISVREYLNNNNIKYIEQHTFENCVNKSKLKFDFYLPYNNIIIEYDGKQHFKPIGYFGGYKSFLNTKKRDYIKNEYCEINNLRMIRIPYWEKEINKKILKKYEL